MRDKDPRDPREPLDPFPERPIPIRDEAHDDDEPGDDEFEDFDEATEAPQHLRGGGDGDGGGSRFGVGNEPGLFGLGRREWRVIGVIVALGVVLAVLLLPPVSLLSRGGGNSSAGENIVTRPRSSMPTLPSGVEAASALYDIEGNRDLPGPVTLTVRLTKSTPDTRSLAFYTYANNEWRRIASVSATDEGKAVRGDVAIIPSNIAVLRRAALAHPFAAIIHASETPDPASETASILSVLAGEPTTGDDGLLLSDRLGGTLQGRYLGLTTSTATAASAINRILADPVATRRHADAIVAAANATQAAGIHIDYLGIESTRRMAFSTFVQQLGERLKQANRGLAVTVAAPRGADTGAYDWNALASVTSAIWLRPPADPSAYYDTLEPGLRAVRESGVDISKVSLVIDRRSRERSGDLIRAISLRDALTAASTVRTRLDQGIAPGDAVTLRGANIDQTEGNSGLRWDERSRMVMYAHASRIGPRTVWIENRFSAAFRLDLARRYGLSGIVVEAATNDAALPDIWDTVLAYVGDNQLFLELPYGPYLQPSWMATEGQIEAAAASGAAIWRAPSRTGTYEITLVVSDGVVFVGQRLPLSVTPNGGRTPTPTASPATATPTAAATATTARTPTATARPATPTPNPVR